MHVINFDLSGRQCSLLFYQNIKTLL